MEFIDKIDSFEDLLRAKHGKFYFSDRGMEEIQQKWDEIKDKVVGHAAVNAAFTDYGGDFTDALVYRKAKEIEGAEDGRIAFAEPTSWNGGNAIILGELADEMRDGYKQNDLYGMYKPLGDFDEDTSRLEYEYTQKAIENCYGDCTDDEKEFLSDWLYNNGRLMATELDFDGVACDKALEEYRSKKGEENGDGKTGESVSEATEGGQGGQEDDKITVTKFAIVSGSAIHPKLYDTRALASQEFLAGQGFHDPKNPYKVVKVTVSYDA